MHPRLTLSMITALVLTGAGGGGTGGSHGGGTGGLHGGGIGGLHGGGIGGLHGGGINFLVPPLTGLMGSKLKRTSASLVSSGDTVFKQ